MSAAIGIATSSQQPRPVLDDDCVEGAEPMSVSETMGGVARVASELQQSCANAFSEHTFAAAQSLGILDANSKLLASLGGADDMHRSKWSPLDWLLGTQIGQFTTLAMLAVVLVFLGTICWVATGGNADYSDSWNQALWFSWGMFFDPGTQMGFAAGEPGKTKTVAVVFSILGFTYNLLMLGLIVETVKQVLDRWRRNRGRIVANDHTLLLGWAEKSLFVIEELILSAQKRDHKLNLVMLADEDAYEIQQEVARHFSTKGIAADIMVRSGSPSECDELDRVSAASARNIFILSGGGHPRIVDLHTVRTVVALAALAKSPRCPIIAEVRTPETSGAIRAVLDTAEGIFALGAVKRVLCLMAVQPAVGETFRMLMSWQRGTSIYCESLKVLNIPEATTIKQAQEFLGKGIIVGVVPAMRHAEMVPEQDRVLEPTDRLLVAAESRKDLIAQKTMAPIPVITPRNISRNSLISLPQMLAMNNQGSNMASADSKARNDPDASSKEKTTIIIVGWPTDADDILSFMDDYIVPGSTVEILASMEVAERDRRLHHNHTFKEQNFKVNHRVGSITSLFALKELPLNEATAVLVLADHSLHEDPRLSDSASLAACVTIDGLLRDRYPDLFKKNPERPRPRIICEVLSAETERALEKDERYMQWNAATIFQTSALEAALFTIASTQAPVFNSFVQLLRRSNAFGDLISLRLQDYLGPDEALEAPLKAEDLISIVRGRGDILLGYVEEGTSEPNMLAKTIEGVMVAKGDGLIILTKRRDELMSVHAIKV